MNKDKALSNIGGKRHKPTFSEKAGRVASGALLAAMGVFIVGEANHDITSKAGDAPTEAVDTGNNTLSTSGLNEALIASRYNKEKGQVIKVKWGSDTLSNFVTNARLQLLLVKVAHRPKKL